MFRFDRTQFAIIDSFEEGERLDREYWHSRTPEERLRYMEYCGGPTMDVQLHADFKEFLKLLNQAQVEYMVIGGYAVGHHGYPRTTKDISGSASTARTSRRRCLARVWLRDACAR